MISFMSSAVRALGFRSIALRLASRSPIMTALAARLLMVISVIGIIVAILALFQNANVMDVIKVPIGLLSLLLSYAMLGAAKEIHCRRNGLPVHPW